MQVGLYFYFHHFGEICGVFRHLFPFYFLNAIIFVVYHRGQFYYCTMIIAIYFLTNHTQVHSFIVHASPHHLTHSHFRATQIMIAISTIHINIFVQNEQTKHEKTNLFLSCHCCINYVYCSYLIILIYLKLIRE